MDNMLSGLICYVIGVMICGGAFILFVPLDVIKSKKPITPDLNIKVINGVSDTTYIYKNK